MARKRHIPDRNANITSLLMQHHGALFGYVFSCVPNYADAEDILQDVSMTAVERFDQLRSEDGFLPWVLEIARRSALAHRRRARRTAVLSGNAISALAEAANAVAQDTASERRIGLLLECVEELPDESAELIRARYDPSFENVEKLAESIGRTESATYSLITRIRHALRDCVSRKIAAEESR
jgi:RNA polymerase sigma-70 factor (ECF subfamily)